MYLSWIDCICFLRFDSDYMDNVPCPCKMEGGGHITKNWGIKITIYILFVNHITKFHKQSKIVKNIYLIDILPKFKMIDFKPKS